MLEPNPGMSPIRLRFSLRRHSRRTYARDVTGSVRIRWSAAAAGLASVVLGEGVGELTAALVAPSSSPFAAIGGALIDGAPPWAKDAAIGLFGTNDKAALLTGIAIVLLVLAGIAGLVELRLPPAGRVVCLVFGGVGVVAATTRTDAGVLAWAPATMAGIIAAVTIGPLVRLARSLADRSADAPAAAGDADPTRRRFLAWTLAAAGVGVLAAVGGSLLRAGTQAATAVRNAIHLPKAAVTTTVPASANLGIPGLAPVITPNDDFYRIDTALVVPQIDPEQWSLRIHGLVEQEVTLSWAQLLALPLEESVTTLTCVSNDVGGDLISNAVWLGYPIRNLLARAVPRSGADMVLSTSIDGFTASTPLEALTDPDRAAILAVGMNGVPLPPEHGFPVRMVVPGLYGYVSATKWVVDLEVTRFADATAYWTERGWSARGPVKLASRIDVPRDGAGVGAGDTVIAGVAWQQHVGVKGVQVQVDGGPWQQATLATAISDDTWVQWKLPWRAAAGTHTIRCRATNDQGQTQTSQVAPPAPDGATGWHQIQVTVS